MERKILVAVDEGEESSYALSWCLNNIISTTSSSSSNDTLILLYAKPTRTLYPAVDGTGYLFSPDIVATMERYGNQVAESVMLKAKKLCQNYPQIKVETKVEYGDARDVICEVAEKLNVDMVVLGSHGYGALKRVAESMKFRKRIIQFMVFVCGLLLLLSTTADKCRQLVGKTASSKNGEFSVLNCFDWSTGSLACTIKEGVKLYCNNIRDTHVELARHKSVNTALVDAASQGLSGKKAEKKAEKQGEKAAKQANRNVDRVLGPIISSGWDFFEAIYYGGSMTEGFLRSGGTLVGTYVVGFLGEKRFGRVGYLLGSQTGSWFGGRIGLMVYDIVNGVNYLLESIRNRATISSVTP